MKGHFDKHGWWVVKFTDEEVKSFKKKFNEEESKKRKKENRGD